MGLLFTLASLITFSSQISSDDEVSEENADGDDPKKEELIDKKVEDEETAKEKKKASVNNTVDEDRDEAAKAHTFPISAATIYFHLGMILAACYLSMLCTNWGNMSIFDNTTDFFKGDNGSFWLKIVAQWFTIVLFVFSLIGPKLCPNRDFGQG